MQIFKLATMHTVNKVRNQIHRARTIQRYKGNNFFKFTRTCFFEHAFHTDGFKLEHRCGISIREDFIGIDIIKWNTFNRQRLFDIATFINILNRVFNHGQVTQTQEVEFNQACGFNVIFIKLCNTAGSIRFTHDRRIIRDFTRRNHHATCVFTCITGNPFQFECHFPNFTGIIIIWIGRIGDDVLELRFHVNGLL